MVDKFLGKTGSSFARRSDVNMPKGLGVIISQRFAPLFSQSSAAMNTSFEKWIAPDQRRSLAARRISRANGSWLLLLAIFAVSLPQTAVAQSSNGIGNSARQQIASILETKKTFT